ncbi:MAG: hypothetical protein Q8M15_02080 [Bacteroidota bacterium]|nr:hypothetical protein [Bacteroidota bacterium]
MIKSLIFGTTIVVISDTTEITIVADSKIHDHNKTKIEPLCKVYQFGDIIFCHAGIMNGNNFSIAQIVKETFTSSSGTLEKILELIQDITKETVLPVFQKIFMEDRKNFDLHLKNKPIIQMAFSFWYKSNPHFFLMIFEPVLNGGTVEINVHRDSVSEPSDFYLGHFDNINEYIQRNPSYKKDRDTIAIAKELIGLEIKAMPDKVGEPLTVVKISGNGIEWVEAGAC